MSRRIVLAGGDGLLGAAVAGGGWRVSAVSGLERAAALADELGAELLVLGDREPRWHPRILALLRRQDSGAGTRVVVALRTGSDLEALECLRAGAAEHVRLPCHPALLRLRLERLLSTPDPPEQSLTCGPLRLDGRRHLVTLGGCSVTVPRREFELLRCLLSEPDRVFTREELLARAWGYSGEGLTTRTLDSHASRLRRRLAPHGGPWITNIWGVGYRLR